MEEKEKQRRVEPDYPGFTGRKPVDRRLRAKAWRWVICGLVLGWIALALLVLLLF